MSRQHDHWPAGLLHVSVCLLLWFGQVESSNNLVPSPQNKFYLNEFCDLYSRSPTNSNKQKQDDKTQLLLHNKSQFSSVQVQPGFVASQPETTAAPLGQADIIGTMNRPMANGIEFEFNSTQTQSQPAVIRQLNCNFIVIAPKSHGLLMLVNSIGLPKNLTKLTITLNYMTNHSQEIHLEGDEKRMSQYLLTQHSEINSKIAIRLQSFKPIDWSQVSFDILFSVYRKLDKSGCPNSRWFDCGDDICVPASLVCDQTPNCPNGNDEMIFYKCHATLFKSIAFTLVLLLIMLITIICFILCNICRRDRTAGGQVVDVRMNDEIPDNYSASYISTDKLDLVSEFDKMSTRHYLETNLYSSDVNQYVGKQSFTNSESAPNLGFDSAVTSTSGVYR